jgi:LPS-assembly protein
MKNKIFIILYLFFYSSNTFADNLSIQAENITINKDGMTSVFQDKVTVKSDEKLIKSEYVKYNKKLGYLLIKDNIVATDNKNNLIQASMAEYFEESKILKTIGNTKIVTSDKYVLEGSDITIDNKNALIKSQKISILTDLDGNKISLKNFEYQTNKNIFRSIGFVKIDDNKKNSIEFSQVYIDTKKREILGSDIKAFLNDENFKISEKNKPRIFANNFSSKNEENIFIKSIFTLCDYRKNDKCPPWSIQSSKMLHDSKKKTIYYDNAIIKVYDIPIFYIPKLSHPDPSVDRRSGFLPPSISDTKNLGESISIPYFFDIAKNKNFTLTNRLYTSENPLFLGEYHHVLKNSFFMADFGYTEGYKKTSTTKRKGEKSHFFSKFVKNFNGRNNSENTLSFSIQDTSNDKYLKLYKIKSNLVDYNTDVLESSLKFLHQTEKAFFSLDASIFETTKETYEDKYEFILPEITFDTNLFNNDKFGSLDLQSNLKVRSYETNKLENFLINDFDWESKEFNFNSGVNSKFLANLKNINYEAKNISKFKEKTTNEFFGSLGILTDINLEKISNNAKHSLTPKMLLRLSPGSMRKKENGSRLTPLSAFNINRSENINDYETGISGTLGFDYKIIKEDSNFDLSIAQVINEKENNKIADKTSLNEKLSDLVGSSKYVVNKNIDIKYDFSVDQNYQDLNYNEIGTTLKYNALDFNFGFLQEKKHIGNQEYFKTKIDLKNKENGLFSFETKRNLITNSSEFYNLSYEYLNDCLRAGLVFRREFYNDSELEPENSLLFKITLMPFGNINSPTFSK